MELKKIGVSFNTSELNRLFEKQAVFSRVGSLLLAVVTVCCLSIDSRRGEEGLILEIGETIVPNVGLLIATFTLAYSCYLLLLSMKLNKLRFKTAIVKKSSLENYSEDSTITQLRRSMKYYVKDSSDEYKENEFKLIDKEGYILLYDKKHNSVTCLHNPYISKTKEITE